MDSMDYPKTRTNSIPIVDLFAGPGGLGEGFSRPESPFEILVSVEKDPIARTTLRLRSFLRKLRKAGRAEDAYWRYVTGSGPERGHPWDESSADLWKEADTEARCMTLGDPVDNETLYSLLESKKIRGTDWLLIGGPPCQAYSLIGRARNKGVVGYDAMKDHRHFLYQEYLEIIARFQPAVFVMENVKGILSSRVGGSEMFQTILKDLEFPVSKTGESGHRYTIHSLVEPLTDGKVSKDPPDNVDYLVRAENYGVPQTRHRVILVGVRDDLARVPAPLAKSKAQVSVATALEGLPAVRGGITRVQDTDQLWRQTRQEMLGEMTKTSLRARPEADFLIDALSKLSADGTPQNRESRVLEPLSGDFVGRSDLSSWYVGGARNAVLNHHSRPNMPEDLRRYLYCALFAEKYGRSPKKDEEFVIPGIRPNHSSWDRGIFRDRFHVQRLDAPASTITSHLSKDGHHYIHPDPRQNRSLTVREAARLQTFPDDYFFEGERTSQFVQVGNAVPPFLAFRVAQRVAELFS